MRNATGGIPQSYLEADPTLNDYYTTTGKYEVLELDRQEAEKARPNLSEEKQALLESGKQFYEITFRNVGGLVMPLILEFEYEDGEREVRRIPAEIWKMSEPTVTKVFVTDRPASRITLDPYMETADVDMGNNVWPARPEPTRFEVFQGSPTAVTIRSGRGEPDATCASQCRAPKPAKKSKPATDFAVN